MFDVSTPCEWCEPQGCFHAGVFYGEVLFAFYSKDKTRLEPAKLEAEITDILLETAKDIYPDSTVIISADELKAIVNKNGKSSIVCVFWSDFQPPVAHPILGYRNRVEINAEPVSA